MDDLNQQWWSRWARRYGRVAAVGALLVVSLGPSVVRGLTKAQGPLPRGYVAQSPQGAYTELKWDALHGGRWPAGGEPRVVDAVGHLDSQPVHVKGFLLPLHQGDEASEFFLAAQPGGCYFCNPPGVSDVVMLVTPSGKKLPITDKPVDAYGTLRVASGGSKDQALYVIQDTTFVLKRSLVDVASP